jgi:hypothetical protein
MEGTVHFKAVPVFVATSMNIDLQAAHRNSVSGLAPHARPFRRKAIGQA